MLETCLVVDDHEMIRETISIMINSLGFKDIFTATDGADAISKIYHQRPALVITDLQMDPIDGLEMLRIIRSGRYGLPHDVTIIILTANASEQVISECIAFDVDAFLVKPVKKESLHHRINQLNQQVKPKKPAKHYFNIYQQDPTKKNVFQHSGDVGLSEQDMQAFNKLATESAQTQTAEIKKVGKLLPYETQGFEGKTFIIWQDKFSLNNPELDRSNQALLSIINQTYHLLLENKEGPSAFEKVFQQFQSYMKIHLQREEELLAQYHYDDLEQHKELHSELVYQADLILLKCQADPNAFANDFFKLLRYWWLKHIIQEDCKYKNIFI